MTSPGQRSPSGKPRHKAVRYGIVIDQIIPQEHTFWGAALVYDPDDPLAVTIDFGDDVPGFSWVCSRDLLADGLKGHSGIGDMRLWPDGDQIMIALSSHEGSGLLSIDRVDMFDFLKATYEIVRRGRERLNLSNTTLARQLSEWS